jgi:phage/plasmid-like protein (TIGR03299 family)
MAHDLATTNGRTAMFYHGETPWHRLGTKLENPATAAEAITAAGLDYQVELSPLATTSGTPVPQRKAVIRTDSTVALGVVGNNYVPIQNHECFGFLDAVVSEAGLRYHTAGALGKGERIWMLAKLPGHLRVKSSDDITEKYLLLSNSHDGSSALRVFFTPIRVVCANTLAVADRRGHGQGIAIQHTGDLAAKVHEAQRVLGFAHRFYDDLQGQINRLASYYPTPNQIANYFEALYPDPTVGNTTRAQNIRETLHRLFEEGRGQDAYKVRGTAWAALNAVTEFVDHHRLTRGGTDLQRADRRLRSQWFGSGATLKQHAWRSALEMANAN